jgi:hypothetical protein
MFGTNLRIDRFFCFCFSDCNLLIVPASPEKIILGNCLCPENWKKLNFCGVEKEEKMFVLYKKG